MPIAWLSTHESSNADPIYKSESYLIGHYIGDYFICKLVSNLVLLEFFDDTLDFLVCVVFFN